MASTKKLAKIVMNIYRELYAMCTTPMLFDILVQTSPRDENGKVIIPYDDYEIDEDLFDEIVNKNLKKHRLSSYEKSMVKWEIYLGCSPKTFKKSVETQVTA